MRKVKYSELERGKSYVHYKRESGRKCFCIFQLTDPKPVMNSFSIMKIQEGLVAFGDKHIYNVDNIASTILPEDVQYFFELSPQEFRSHVLIPQL